MFFFELLFFMLLLFFIFYFISFKMDLSIESFSSYECGFDSMSNARHIFSYRFFLVSILFLIFDVEITLMLSIPFINVSFFSFFIFLVFVFILLFGLLYEYMYGSLEWI